MEEYSINCYLPLCEQYERMAQSFFQQYNDLNAKHTNLGKPKDYLEDPVGASVQMQLTLDILHAAIASIVFEAFAIESYVNFWGAYRLGDESYYSNYESTNKKKSTLEKMKQICKDEFKSPYPTGGTHYAHLKALLKKRDRLAHNKSTGYLVSCQNGQYVDEFDNAYKEYAFIFESLDEDMKLYKEVKNNLAKCSGKPEPTEELVQKAYSVMERSLINIISPLLP